MLQSLFYLKTALHVSVVTITHLQEHKTILTTASGNHYTVIQFFTVKDQINSPPTHSDQFQLFQDSNRQQYRYVHHSLFYRTYCIFRRIYIINKNCNFNLIYRYSLTVKNSIYYIVTVTKCCSYSCFVLLKMSDNTRNM
jgi:hypothetical protein